MFIVKDDFGFYGKGLDGYVHYKQSVDRIGGEDSSGDPVSKRKTALEVKIEDNKSRYKAEKEAFIARMKKHDEEHENKYKDDPDWKEKLGKEFDDFNTATLKWTIIFYGGLFLIFLIFIFLGDG